MRFDWAARASALIGLRPAVIGIGPSAGLATRLDTPGGRPRRLMVVVPMRAVIAALIRFCSAISSLQIVSMVKTDLPSFYKAVNGPGKANRTKRPPGLFVARKTTTPIFTTLNICRAIAALLAPGTSWNNGVTNSLKRQAISLDYVTYFLICSWRGESDIAN